MNNEAVQILNHSSNSTNPAPTEPTVEAQAPEAPQSPDPKQERVSNKLEMLIRREQALRSKEQQYSSKEQEFAKKEAEYQAVKKRLEDLEAAKGNSKKFMELLGMDYNQLTESLLKDGQTPPEVEIKKVRDEIAELKKSQEAEKERMALEEKRRIEQLENQRVQEFKDEIGSHLKDNPEKYEFTHYEYGDGAIEQLYAVIDAHYQETAKESENGVGKIMSIQEAAEKTEKYLEDKYSKFKSLKKAQNLLQDSTMAKWNNLPKEVQQTLMKQKQSESIKKPIEKPITTLTNSLAASTQKPTTRTLTDAERIQRAIAYAKQLRPNI